MDDFFKKNFCDRCGAELKVRIMSMFNEDVICMECKEKETQREDYAYARDVEMEEVRKGNYNFKGVGLK
jgi:hypothetical protein